MPPRGIRFKWTKEQIKQFKFIEDIERKLDIFFSRAAMRWRLFLEKSEDETPVVPAIRCEVFTDTWHFEGPCPSYRCDPLHLQSGQMGYSQHNRQQLNKQHTWGGSPPIPDCQSGFGAFLKHH